MKTIIFDMDGTIIDSSYAIVEGINSIRKTLGLSPLTFETIMQVVNDPAVNWAKELYEVDEVTPEIFDQFEVLFKSLHIEHSILYDGMKELLLTCKQHGCELAIATNAPDYAAHAILKKFGLDELFFSVMGANQVSLPKPHPEMLLKIKEAGQYDEVWMVGDSEKDRQAAHNAQVNYLHVNWGFGEVDNHDHHVHSPKEALVKLLPNFM